MAFRIFGNEREMRMWIRGSWDGVLGGGKRGVVGRWGLEGIRENKDGWLWIF